jgi:hypothetical protein
VVRGTGPAVKCVCVGDHAGVHRAQPEDRKGFEPVESQSRQPGVDLVIVHYTGTWYLAIAKQVRVLACLPRAVLISGVRLHTLADHLNNSIIFSSGALRFAEHCRRKIDRRPMKSHS